MKKVAHGVMFYLLSLTIIVLVGGGIAFVNNNFEIVQGKINFLSKATVEADKIAFSELEKSKTELERTKQETAEAIAKTVAYTDEKLAATTALADAANRKPTLDNKISKVILDNKSSVVYVEISFKEEYAERASAAGAQGNALGTGWFVEVNDDYAYIVTNHHVIEPYLKAPEWLNIGIYDLNTPWLSPVEIVGSDPIMDIAVLKVENYENSGYRALKWTDHSKTAEGDPVVAIGHGLSLPWSMSSGIITALDRWQISPMNMMIQTDTVVNKGNSGGPLLNLDGEVVGVVSALLDPNGTLNKNAAAYAGVSLIIAGWQAEKSVNEIIARGKAEYPYFDFRLRNPDREEYTEKFGTELGKPMVMIAHVDQNTQSSGLDIKPGDWILEFEDRPLTGMVSLVKMVLEYNPGDMVKLKLNRDGKDHIVYYTLENFKDYR